jgi:hypothetical protein
MLRPKEEVKKLELKSGECTSFATAASSLREK